MLKMTGKGCIMCQWIMGFLERGNLKNRCHVCWSSVNGDSR